MSDSHDGDNLFEDADQSIEELIRLLGASRRFDLSKYEDAPEIEADESDETISNRLDFRRPESLEELRALLSSESDSVEQRRQRDENREKRIMTAFYIFGGAGIVVSAITGNPAILAVILAFFLRLFRTLF